MSELQIKADLNEAINQLAQKLGIAAEEILPYYTKLEFIRGITWTIGGLLAATLPWLLFLFSPGEGWEIFFTGLWWAGRMIFCVALTWSGLYTIVDHIENLYAPKALAIQELLNQIT